MEVKRKVEISLNLLNYIKEEINSREHVNVIIQKKGSCRPIDVVTEYRRRFEKGELKEGQEIEVENMSRNQFRKG